MTTINFADYYFLGTSAPTASTTYNGASGDPWTVTDDQDGTPDGSALIGSDVTVTQNSGTPFLAEFYGVVAATGDPIIFVSSFGPPLYYVLSDNSSLTGPLGTLTTTGTAALCFAAGTQIATPTGPRAVESLEQGETILTAQGTQVPVKWVGRQTLHRRVMGAKMQPVRIRAGALGNGLPQSDLTVTADHGMVIDGYVINASALVNGTTIDWVPMDELEDRFTVYHIETEAHDVILANGAPSETFIDYAGRAAFDNHAEYLDLYGAERIIRENPMPRIAASRLLPQAIRDRLAPKSTVSRRNLQKSA